MKTIAGGLIVGLFSMIFGANEVEITRPDFTNVINKTVHFDNDVSLSYEIPGNLSNLMGFAGGYIASSPRTFNVSLDEQEGFSQNRWRMAKNIEGSMWDYLGDKKKGLGGELGTLYFDLSINQYSGSSLEKYILREYETYLNGPSGKNTKVRIDEMGEAIPDEELGDWIVHAPAVIEKRMVGAVEFFYWQQRNEHRGYEFVYYALPLNEQRFVSFMFKYTVKANTEQDLEEQTAIMLDDIDTFMQRVVIDKPTRRT